MDIDFTDKFCVLTVEFAKSFQSKLIEIYKPDFEITYWSFYAVVEDYIGYESTFDEVCNEYGLTDFFSFKKDLLWYEKDDFIRDLTSRILILLDIQKGRIDEYSSL